MHQAEETWNYLPASSHKDELRGLMDELWEQSNVLVDIAGEVSGQMPSPSKQSLSDLGDNRDVYVMFFVITNCCYFNIYIFV